MKRLLVACLVLAGLFSCNKDSVSQSGSFAKGGDVGWLSEMEAAGIKFRHKSGQEDDLFNILKGVGMNSIRLRVWVNPTDGWCNQADVVKQALRASQAGMKVMIDFHYSNWWADPGKQNKPEAWKSLDQAGLLAAIDTHTRLVLTALKNAGVTPTWVQAGNETNDGMLWENGRASKNMAAFSAMVNASYKAIKEVFPSAKVIVHISNGYDNSLFRWMFDGLKANNTNYDVIGMSLYPDPNNWFAANEQTNFNMKDMIARYGKEIMISEVGMPVDQADKCRQFIEDLMKRVKNLPDQKGLGVFYWEPECHNDWKGYKLGAFDNQGRPTVALDAFKN
jgi:arabinogalactan endo-1,4-beta-galactosidase